MSGGADKRPYYHRHGHRGGGYGNQGSGSLLGNPGSGSILGNPGSGSILGNLGSGSILGTPGAGSLLCNPGLGSILGNPGSGSILGNPGSGSILGNPGSGSILGNPPSGCIFGNPGSGSIFGHLGSGSLLGDPGSGSILGNPGSGSILGNPGSGSILGNPGSTSILGNPGSTSILGNPGSGSIFGNPGLGNILGNQGAGSISDNPGSGSIWGNQGLGRSVNNQGSRNGFTNDGPGDGYDNHGRDFPHQGSGYDNHGRDYPHPGSSYDNHGRDYPHQGSGFDNHDRGYSHQRRGYDNQKPRRRSRFSDYESSEYGQDSNRDFSCRGPSNSGSSHSFHRSNCEQPHFPNYGYEPLIPGQSISGEVGRTRKRVKKNTSNSGLGYAEESCRPIPRPTNTNIPGAKVGKGRGGGSNCRESRPYVGEIDDYEECIEDRSSDYGDSLREDSEGRSSEDDLSEDEYSVCVDGESGELVRLPLSRKRVRTGATRDGRSESPPPSHLTGKELGHWGQQRALTRPDRLPRIVMSKEEAARLDRLLVSLGKSSFTNESSRSLNCMDVGKAGEKNSTHSRTIDGMGDSAFKREYMNNVSANQADGGPGADPPVTNNLVHEEELDQRFLEELLRKEQVPEFLAMSKKCGQLPCYKVKDEILEILEHNQVLVLTGETGCGKTTQVPQFLLDSEIMAGRGSVCHVVCTQPRRISAISTAQRVAEERGERLGKSVGYQIRLEAVRARTRGSIYYCTTGIVLERLKKNPLLINVSHLVIDEIHERDMQTDFLMAVVKNLLPKRPDLKVILMSATLNAVQFSEYFGGCPTIHIPGFTYPVKEYYLEDVLEMTKFVFPGSNKESRPSNKKSLPLHTPTDEDGQIQEWISTRESKGELSPLCATQLRRPHSEDLSPALVLQLLRHVCAQPPGAVLVFLPGLAEITDMMRRLDKDHFIISQKTIVIPLHSSLPAAYQAEVFERPPKGVRKIVLATSIAETSITIADIVYVIDGGYSKQRSFEEESDLPTLQPVFVTRANAEQRRGRAGRVQDGICYHLFTRKRKELLDDYPLPEVLRVHLEEIILMAKILKLGRVKPFLAKLMQSPKEEMIETAIKILTSIRALDENENLTPLGFHMAKLPVDPLTGRMLLMAAIFSCVDPILTVAAVMSLKDPFVVPPGSENQVDEIRRSFSGNKHSDHLMYVKVFDAWRDAQAAGNSDFCWENFLSPTVLQQLSFLREHFFRLLKDRQFISKTVRSTNEVAVNRNSCSLAMVRAVLTSGLYPNVARILVPARKRRNRSRAPFILLEGNYNVSLHRKCVIQSYEGLVSPWLLYKEKMRVKKVLLSDATMVPNYPLLLFGQHLLYNATDEVIDVDGFVRVKCRRQVFDVMRKLRHELDALLEYKISNPGVTEWSAFSPESKLLGAIVDLVNSETLQLLMPQAKTVIRLNKTNSLSDHD